MKTQRKDGSFCDYLGQGYLIVSGTAYAALTLNEGLRPRSTGKDGPVSGADGR